MLDAIRWDARLIQAFDRCGPHYTTYPPSERFEARVGGFDLLRALRDSRQAQRPLSLQVQLPLCTGETLARRNRPSYLQCLAHEADLIGCHLGPRQRVEQLHLGGAPSALDHDALRQLLGHLRQRFALLDDDSGDYGIEIDPRVADWPTLGLLRELGFNRVSIGPQQLGPARIGPARIGPDEDGPHLAQTRSLIEAARTLHYRSVNIDLVHGRPGQSPLAFARTVAALIELQPDRVSLFDHRDRPARSAPLQALDDPAASQAMRQTCIEQLTAAGYRYIGLELFVLPDDDLAMAQEKGRLRRGAGGYSAHGHCDLIGLGLGAISQLGDLYTQNCEDPRRYQARLAGGQLPVVRGLHCAADDLVRRAVIETLLCDFELEFRALETRFGLDFRGYFAAAWPGLERLAGEGLIDLDEQGIDILPAGRLLVQAVCRLFDRYDAPPCAQAPAPG
ncbi:MAG TPA: coproporphyrinogen III oxidase [Pseudomonas sp.]|nr:coproporphyrinogen III oxidase [Pseudomonas sp.]